jgi:hypothetical protein
METIFGLSTAVLNELKLLAAKVVVPTNYSGGKDWMTYPVIVKIL